MCIALAFSVLVPVSKSMLFGNNLLDENVAKKFILPLKSRDNYYDENLCRMASIFQCLEIYWLKFLYGITEWHWLGSNICVGSRMVRAGARVPAAAPSRGLASHHQPPSIECLVSWIFPNESGGEEIKLNFLRFKTENKFSNKCPPCKFLINNVFPHTKEILGTR